MSAGESCPCGSPSTHTISQNGQTAYRCCRCYVNNGGVPADWHRDCMETQARRAYNRSLQCHFDNQRTVNVHDDWSVAKSREDCIPFTVTIYNPDNLAKYTREGLVRALSGQRVLKSQLPRSYS